MNERIEELIKQAQINDLAIDTNGDLYDVKRLDPEKFAELIVRECLDILMNAPVMKWPEGLRSELSDYNKGWVNGRLLGIEHIEEHFGVKE